MTKLETLQKRFSAIPDITRLTPGECDALRREFPGLPQDYLDFMETIGWGNFEDGMMIYGGPILPEELNLQKVIPENIILIGDNFRGFLFGFDTKHAFEPIQVYRGRMSYFEGDFFALIELHCPDESSEGNQDLELE